MDNSNINTVGQNDSETNNKNEALEKLNKNAMQLTITDLESTINGYRNRFVISQNIIEQYRLISIEDNELINKQNSIIERTKKENELMKEKNEMLEKDVQNNKRKAIVLLPHEQDEKYKTIIENLKEAHRKNNNLHIEAHNKLSHQLSTCKIAIEELNETIAKQNEEIRNLNIMIADKNRIIHSYADPQI